jgi:hypothetical protein
LTQLDLTLLLIRSIRNVVFTHRSIINELWFTVFDSLVLSDFVEEEEIDDLEPDDS